jgi:hypothetical protein
LRRKTGRNDAISLGKWGKKESGKHKKTAPENRGGNGTVKV